VTHSTDERLPTTADSTLWDECAELLATVISHEARKVIGNSDAKEPGASTTHG